VDDKVRERAADVDADAQRCRHAGIITRGYGVTITS
jgi:hypothetical protein